MTGYLAFLLWALSLPSGKAPYLSPGAMAVDEKRDVLYTALTTAGSVAVTDLKTGRTGEEIALGQNPNDLILSPDGALLYVSCGEAKGTVEIIDLREKKRKAAVAVGHTPQKMALSPGGERLYVANRYTHTVSVVDIARRKAIASIPAVREPRALCLSPDGKSLAVANFLPAQAATDPVVAAQITLIDTQSHAVRANVTLENGAQSVAGLAISPDGHYLYAVHVLSRFNVPITQLERGWVNTNALSIIDLKTDALYATLLLDDVSYGAANPAGIRIDENRQAYIALSGTHELMVLDCKSLHEYLDAFFDGKKTDAFIRDKEELSASLSFLYPFKKRIRLQGRSPREVVYSNGRIFVSSRFSPFVEQISAKGDPSPAILPLGNEPPPDAVRRGELAFCDASICYQQWQSCASCHPDGRADGLNWDQQNDGLGNPKNTKSLLYSHVTPPCMITGIRASAESAVRNGILHTLRTRQPETLAADIDDYLKHLAPVESPYLAEYRKKDPRQKGKKLFEQAGCARCHEGKYLTDGTAYDVATGDGNDRGRPFDTPSLSEAWRTAPYLYDGRAATLREVFGTWNPDDRHGFTKNLSKDDLDALILYIQTL
ncbi:MAG: c-type cytochrome [Tannerellaceae bacterium]|jgi:YVTN family beta-propeller protein|nr:c-type cytochrome [Tannerellaceae bacterium]